MRAALARLNPRDASCFVMRHLHGLAPAAIGSALGISENHVSVSVHRARKALEAIACQGAIPMNSLDRTLELFALREPEPALVNDAQRKLEALVANRVAQASARRPVRHARGWLAAATTAAVVAVAMLWLPFGSAPALAFAKMQEHFRDFRTLRFDIEQRMNGKVVMKSRVSVTRDGNVRTDVGDDISVIVNSTEKRVLTLMHSAHVADAVRRSTSRRPRTTRSRGSTTSATSRARPSCCRRPGGSAASGLMAGSSRRPAVKSCSGPPTRACRSR